MTTKVLYIDDEYGRQDRDAQKIRDLLQAPGILECVLQEPPERLSELAGQLPDALLVDQDLSSVLPGKEPVGYLGSSLASEMRMRQPDCPIVLITRPNMLASTLQIRLIEESGDIDLTLMKDDIQQDPSGQRDKIIALTEGFKALAEISGETWQSVLELMGATVDEASLLREAGPPIEHGQWNVPQTARWIRNTVMDFPGILYDDLTAASRLGISVESFRTPELQQGFQGAEYTGIFASFSRRWWRDRLFERAQEVMLRHDLRGSISQKFAEAFEKETGLTLAPAICVSDGTPIADWVCYILKAPVKQRNSIPYYPDERPAVMDQARVSLKAIRQSNEFDDTLVDADSLSVVKKIWGLA